MEESLKEEGFWYPLNMYTLSRQTPSNLIVQYLKRLLAEVSMGSDDSFDVCLSKNMVRFKCSYLTHCRLIKTMTEMFLYKGIGFAHCDVRFESKKIKTKLLSPLSPVALVVIKVDISRLNKCEIMIDNNL